MTGYSWVEGEAITAVKLNSIRNDLLENNAMAGFLDAQRGTFSIASGVSFVDVVVAAHSARAVFQVLGARLNTASNVAVGVSPAPFDATHWRITRQGATDQVDGTWVLWEPRG